MAAGCARRRSRTGRPPAPGNRPAPGTLGQPSPGWPRTVERGRRHLLQQLGGAARDRQLGLQLDDPTPRRHQLLVLVAAQAREQALVDAVLAPPGGDRLGADPQRLGDLGDRPSGLGEVQDLAAELRWVAASSDAVLLSSGSMRNPTTQLHRTGDDHQLGDRPAALPWQVSQQPEHERLARRRGSTRPHRPATPPSSSSSPRCQLAGGTLWPAGTG